METKDEEIVIDLQRVFETFKKGWFIYLVIMIICAVSALAFTIFLIPKSYTTSGKIIVVKQFDSQSTSDSLSYSDLQLSEKLVDTYSEIIKSEIISDTVTKNLNLDISNAEYNNMLTVGSSNSTEVIQITIESRDANLSAKMVNEIIEVFINKIDSIMSVNNVSVLNNAKVPDKASSPSILTNTVIGFVLGILISSAIILLKVMFDTKIKSEAEIKEIFTYPIIGKIPKIITNEKGEYINEYQRKIKS